MCWLVSWRFLYRISVPSCSSTVLRFCISIKLNCFMNYKFLKCPWIILSRICSRTSLWIQNFNPSMIIIYHRITISFLDSWLIWHYGYTLPPGSIVSWPTCTLDHNQVIFWSHNFNPSMIIICHRSIVLFLDSWIIWYYRYTLSPGSIVYRSMHILDHDQVIFWSQDFNPSIIIICCRIKISFLNLQIIWNYDYMLPFGSKISRFMRTPAHDRGTSHIKDIDVGLRLFSNLRATLFLFPSDQVSNTDKVLLLI